MTLVFLVLLVFIGVAFAVIVSRSMKAANADAMRRRDHRGGGGMRHEDHIVHAALWSQALAGSSDAAAGQVPEMLSESPSVPVESSHPHHHVDVPDPAPSVDAGASCNDLGGSDFCGAGGD